ncbi:hypothetical protein LZ32DRAFT_27032 [Colletotrichum eremochloae]|nr:hypothetical protein LZ32DRAFT_27032 [Colletotrichum eremochloae]
MTTYHFGILSLFLLCFPIYPCMLTILSARHALTNSYSGIWADTHVRSIHAAPVSAGHYWLAYHSPVSCLAGCR